MVPMRVSTQLSLNVYFLVCLIPSLLTKKCFDLSQLWWCMLLILAPRRQRQDISEFEANLVYVVRAARESYTIRHHLKKQKSNKQAPNLKINKIIFCHITLKIYTYVYISIYVSVCVRARVCACVCALHWIN